MTRKVEAVAENLEPGSFGLVGPSGPAGGDEKVSPTWLILQRLEDLSKRMDSLEQSLNKRMDAMEQGLRDVRAEVSSVRNWSLGLLLLAILGLLAKLLIPGA